MPIRIQRKRTKGWRLPENTVCVTRPGKYGNPCRVGMFKEYGAADAKRDYRLNDIRKDLRGRDLACWCALDQPCHADVLLELANAETEETA